MWTDAETAGDPAASSKDTVVSSPLLSSIIMYNISLVSCYLVRSLATWRTLGLILQNVFFDPYIFPTIKINNTGKENLFVTFQQPESVVKEEPHEVLLRANAKGILDKIGSKHQLTRKEQRGHTNKMTKQTNAGTSQPHFSVSIQSKNRETKGSNSSTLCGHQGNSNRRQSLQGGHNYFSLISYGVHTTD